MFRTLLHIRAYTLILFIGTFSAACSSQGISQAEIDQTEQAALAELSDIGLIQLDEEGNVITSESDIEIPEIEIPEFRWSLVAIEQNGVRTDLDVLDPDPNWLANNFIDSSISDEDQTLDGYLECSSVTWDLRNIGLNIFALDLVVLEQTDTDCVNNTPEGLVSSVLADLGIIMIDPAVENEIEIFNGNGVSLFFSPVGL